jgi:AraC-like DNA-binding protein
MDPLSDLLALLKPQSYVSAGFDAGGDWSIRFAHQQDRMKCYAVISGGCWLAVDDLNEPVRLEAGDCFVLPTGRAFTLASNLDLPSVEAKSVFPPPQNGGIITHNGGGDLYLAGSRFAVSGHIAGMLLDLLPPIIHLRNEADQDALRFSVERMMAELRQGQPGGHLVAQHLAHMMLVQALRLHLASASGAGTGWFHALADDNLRLAIEAIHADPSRRWTLADLAAVSAMSRSNFALRFKEVLGETPMEYLARWRMLVAGDRLLNTGDPIATIALSLGYESESAFSTAFKRVMGCTPRQYGRPEPALPSSKVPLPPLSRHPEQVAGHA